MVVVAAVALATGLVTAPAEAGGGVLDDLRGRLAPRLVDLGVPGDGIPIAINDDGVVVGMTTAADGTRRPFRWSDGRVELMPDVARGARALGVDGVGRVLVQTTLPWNLLLWEPDGTLVVVSPGSTRSAYVNDEGLIAMTVGAADGRTQARTWRDGLVTDLPDLGAGAQALAVGDGGVVAGTVTGPGGGLRVALWRDGSLTVLPGPEVAVVETIDVGGDGAVTARLQVAGAPPRGVVWYGGRMLDLTGDAGDDVVPMDVNEDGVVVGWYLDTREPAAVGRALVRGPRFGPVDLPTLGGRSAFAYAVDDHGLVVGSAQRPGDVRLVHAVAWVAGVPVPLGERLPGVHVQGSAAYGVNERGQVIGVLNAGSPGDLLPGQRAVLWELDPRR